jgi:regulator of sirC expression with transglutaminase-like and TPR domain
MPMHFLVRVLGVDPPIFIDSYGGGRLLSVEECQAALERMAGRAFPFRPEMLDVVSNRDILTRFLTNLKLIYLNSGVFQKGIAMLERLLVLNPAMPLLLRERGLINLMLGQADQARRDLRHYVELAQDAPDIQEIIDLLKRMG